MASEAAAVIEDILPIPASTDPENEVVANSMDEKPTTSHALAIADHDEKGAAQAEHDQDVVDLGWNEDPRSIENPLVGGIKNEDLWVLVRRFNKQAYHFKEITTQVPGGLDANIAADEEFSPDKLRSNLERLYMTVIVSIVGAINHVARLRSWRETRRTSLFAATYLIAWAFDFLMPIISIAIIVILVSPRARLAMFPPAPLALVNKKTGGVQKPKSGVLGSHDSLTGASENMKGQAVEEEASNFVTGIASIALASTTGKHPQGEIEAENSDGTPADSAVPDPTAIATGAGAARDASAGTSAGVNRDKTKAAVQNSMWEMMRPLMHILGQVCDTWERFANALSPTAPYNRSIYRLRLAGLVVPLVLVSLYVTPYMFIKGLTFGIGFGFFGDPVLTPGIQWLNNTFPNWQKILEPRNTILKGVPTNAQLTITLLRIGENSKSPLPPPPQSDETPPDKPAELTEEDLQATGGDTPLNATKEELDAAMKHDPNVVHETSSSDIKTAAATKHGKTGSTILSFFKGTTKAAVQTAIGTDTIRAVAGSNPAKNRLGVVPARHENLLSGPVEFKCRFKGGKGHAYITFENSVPYLAFSKDSKIAELGVAGREAELKPLWKLNITQIAELKKLGGYGWKAKLIVGWAMERNISDALEITSRDGSSTLITALPLRDELFNRLCAMGGQKWELW